MFCNFIVFKFNCWLNVDVKKNDQNKNFFSSDISSNKDLETDKIKTTNVNILLNRVRLDKKRTLKKRIIFLLFLTFIISFAAIYFII